MTPAGSHRCRACAADVPAGALRCPTCNAAQGELPPCPHCRATAGVSPHPELRSVCDVCGGPRVPRLDPTIRFSGREIAPLKRADAARKSRAGWRAGAVVAGLGVPVAAMFVAALALFFGVSITLLVLGTLLFGPVIGALIYAIGRVRSFGREIQPAIDAAWVSAATDVASQTRGGASAQVLAQKLGIDESQADELVALLDVNDAVGAARLRFADAPPAQGAPPPLDAAAAPGFTQVAAAEEEAALAEEAGARPVAATMVGPGPGKS